MVGRRSSSNNPYDHPSAASSLRSRSPSYRSTTTESSSSRNGPPLQRSQSIKDRTANFFGIPTETTTEAAASSNNIWHKKRMRHLNRQYGLKKEIFEAAAEQEEERDNLGDLVANLPPLDGSSTTSLSRGDTESARTPRRRSVDPPARFERKESVIKMAVDVVGSFARGDPFRSSNKAIKNRSFGDSLSLRRSQGTLSDNRSFAPRTPVSLEPLPEATTSAETSFAEPDRPFIGTPVYDEQQRDDEDIPGINRSQFGWRPHVRQGFQFPGTRHQATRGRTRSAPLKHQQKVETDSEEETAPRPPRPREESRVKFADIQEYPMDTERSDNETSTTVSVSSPLRPKDLQLMSKTTTARRGIPSKTATTTMPSDSEGETIPLRPLQRQEVMDETGEEVFFDLPCPQPTFHLGSDGAPSEAGFSISTTTAATAIVTPAKDGAISVSFPNNLQQLLKKKEEAINIRATRTLFDRIRRSFNRSRVSQSVKSLGALIKMSNDRRGERELPFGGSFKKTTNRNQVILQRELDNELYDYRSFFTYYVTFVQLIIMIVALIRYGFGTSFTANYFGVTERGGDVMSPSLSSLHIVVWEQNNIWIGPRYADLIHMGAKYTPCMRRDVKIMERIEDERRLESEETGCCVSSEGCYQTSECSNQFARFLKWTKDSNGIHVSRAVCGQDPRYCGKPASVAPNKWSKDISHWPICQETALQIPSSEAHMKCEIRGRPCCIQMHGQCRITTKEYCDFVRGFYHENATLCSQVNCLGDICGMTPFLRKDSPDQIYRFFTPLFIHAGIIPMLITIWLQFTYMRKFEFLIGWTRVAIIYFVSGIGGYLASAIFIPYMPQVGPIPSQSGILGAMVVNVCVSWKEIQQPHLALFCHLAVALFLFICGFLPFIDNFAQVFGFFFGILLACALIPYVGNPDDGKEDPMKVARGKRVRIMLVAITIPATIALFLFLSILFATVDPSKLPDISAMSCIFKNERLCDQQSLRLNDWLPI